MKYGLSDQQLTEITNIIAAYEEIEEAILFGSRAIDTYKEASDVDIAVQGKKADLELALTLKDQLEEETWLPFFFDIIAWNAITSADLKKQIRTRGKVIYRKSMSAWREVKLGELLKFGNGNKRPCSEGNIPIYGGNGILGYCGHSNYGSKTIIIGRVGAYCGSIFFEDKPIWISDNALSAIPKENYDAKFLYYFLKEIGLNKYAGGSSHPLITQTLLNSLEFKVCISPLEQKAIAEVLSSLDDKIDLLHRQNKTLETLAETLFRQWFVERRPEHVEGKADEWEAKRLMELGDVICGKTPSKKNPNFYEGKVPFIKIPDMHGNTFILKTTDSLSKEGSLSQINKLLPAKTICVSCIATVGLVSITTEPSHTNQQINSIIPKKEEYRYYLYLTMKNAYKELHAMASGGTATLNLNTGNFSKMELAFPDEDLLMNFHSLVEPVFSKILANKTKIRTLEKLRDTLLPKLMSGEVRVKNLKTDGQNDDKQ